MLQWQFILRACFRNHTTQHKHLRLLFQRFLGLTIQMGTVSYPSLCLTNPFLTPNPSAPENVGRLVTPAKKLEDTIRLAELVIEVLQQNQEHHAEVSE